MPDKPFRMLICGPSAAGKTNLLTNILLKPLIQYDKIYLYAKFLEQPKYQYLRDRLEEVSRKVGYDVMECSNGEVAPLDELPSGNQKLFVFDDFLCKAQKKQNRLIDYFIRGRNKNCSVIYLSQSFYKTPKDIRLNCSHFCLFDAQDSREKSAIAEQLDIKPEQYESATREPYSFLYVNKPRKRCAKNFFWRSLKWVYSMMLVIKIFMVNWDLLVLQAQVSIKHLTETMMRKTKNCVLKCVDEKDAANKKYVDDILKGAWLPLGDMLDL